jgi:hypothetical protein
MTNVDDNAGIVYNSLKKPRSGEVGRILNNVASFMEAVLCALQKSLSDYMYIIQEFTIKSTVSWSLGGNVG